MIFWGDAATEGRPNSFHFFREAQEAGAKMVVVDPQYIPACEHADLWVPIRPGSDSAMYMGIMNLIFEKDAAGEDVIDYDYLRSYTVAPFLVREDTGEFLRPADIGMEAPADEKDAYVVIDEASGQPVTVDVVTTAVVWGDQEVNGIKCTPALELLRRKMADYTVERTSEITEVEPDMIRELADICMDGPVYHRISYASSIYDNGQMIVHADSPRRRFTGNFGRLGTNFATNRATPALSYNANPTGPGSAGMARADVGIDSRAGTADVNADGQDPSAAMITRSRCSLRWPATFQRAVGFYDGSARSRMFRSSAPSTEL